MRFLHFLLLVSVCLIWAFSNIVGKIVVDHWSVPPIYFTAVRFALVALVTLPWLLPVPRPFGRIATIALCLGGGNFALLYMGFQTASPSSAAVVLQLGVPFTTLLSIVVLGERIRWRRGLGIALTFVGVMIATLKPEGIAISGGLLLIAAAAMAGAVGAVLMKRVDDVSPLRFQAWVGLLSTVVLGIMSAFFEQDQWTTSFAAGWPFVGAVVFTAIVVSVGAHTAYYFLIQRYEANLLAPLTLITPIATIGFGIAITGDPFDLQMAAGAAVALLGVLIVALRTRPSSALLLDREER